MMGRAMNFSYDKLPEALEAKLFLGSVGKMHLASLARTALLSKEYSAAGVDMLFAAWEADPLDGMLAGQLAQFLPQDDPSGLRAFFSEMAQLWETDAYILRLQQQLKTDKLFVALEQKLKGNTRSLFHLQRAVELGPAQFGPSWSRQFLEQAWPTVLTPALNYARGLLDLLGGDLEQARDCFKALRSVLPLPGVLSKLGECEYRLGNRDRALGLWGEALASRPWDISLLLKAYDVANGLDHATLPLPGGVNIFLYTFNKAGELEQALGALAQCDLRDLENAKVTVLDNGSKDETQAVLRKWEATFGAEVFESISLPVNIGAPAARNWLMHREETIQRPWTIYLDDDAIVPHDWLGRFGAAVEAYPDAGVWGCKVLDAELPHVIQNADLHPRPDYAQEGTFPPGEMSDLQHQTFDLGGFDFIRPCTSVTGCCHLFRAETLLASGDFDLSFSPSQYDDLDHDLRLVLEGKTAVYQGHLAVRHMKRSGKLTQQGGMAFVSGQGNHSKLKAKHGGHAWDHIRQATYDALRKDIQRKFEAVVAGE